jgi:thioredoxin 1
MDTQKIVKHADDVTFESLVIKADKPTLVDFWAPWCGPCRAIAPVLEEIAKEYAEKIDVVKVNVDECPQTASRYGVRSIPTLHLFREGEIRESKVGMMKKDQLSALIDHNLQK